MFVVEGGRAVPGGHLLVVLIQHQPAVHSQPVQCYEPERNRHVVAGLVQYRAFGTVGNSEYRPEESRFVGGRRIVVDEDMPDEREGPGAVVRQAKHKGGPVHVRSVQLVGRVLLL